MPRTRKKRPNWPYRLTWLVICFLLGSYLTTQTILTGLSHRHRSYGVDWPMAFIAGCLDTIFAIWFVTVGACIGSFLNVVAYRVPLGRYVGGHSGCPYCGTPIDSLDNIPVLAWIKLRGRCRTCRLPISIQYPLVEFAVAAVFFVVFVSEFATNGANLPMNTANSAGLGGLVRINLTPTLVLRTVSYLVVLSGLIAAALIAVKGGRVPLKLYIWTLIPHCVVSLCLPKTSVAPWQSNLAALGPIDERLQIAASLMAGLAAGTALGRLLVPVLFPGYDRTLVASDPSSRSARQFVGALAVLGCTLGWQWTVAGTWCVVACGLLCVLFLRGSKRLSVGDLTVWVWLGFLLFRANWSFIARIPSPFETWPEIVRQILGALMLAPICIAYRLQAPTLGISDTHKEPHEMDVENTPPTLFTEELACQNENLPPSQSHSAPPHPLQ
ncbi:MAG: prepilin peptidase [Planctomycetales bacterium]|nr:prepilin peptidase [Planctomycetales bacterium]